MNAAAIEHCTVEDAFTITGDEDLRQYLTTYLQPFAKPQRRENATEGSGFAGNTLCINCGTVQDGMFGSFRWGIAHGEGHCGKCHWPARLYHYLKLADGTEGRLVVLLQYHPDFVTKRKQP